VRGDEAGVAAHQIDDADTGGVRHRLVPRGVDRIRRFGDRRAEPEGMVEEHDVVVNRLWHVRHDNL